MTLPTFTIECEAANDCNKVLAENPLALSKQAYIVWFSGATCSNSIGATVVLQGVSADPTVLLGTSNVAYGSGVFNYSNNQLDVAFGSFAVWVWIDSGGTAQRLDEGEPVACKNITADVPTLGNINLGDESEVSIWSNASQADVDLLPAY